MRKIITVYRLAYNSGEGGGGDPPNNPPPDKTFTQDEVNAFLAKDRREKDAKLKTLTKELETLRENTKLTTEERDNLTRQIDDLRTQYETKEDKTKRELQTLNEERAKERDTLTKERDTWKGLYTNATIERALMDAAVSAQAISAEDIVQLLKSNTSLKERDEEFEVRVRFKDKDTEGKDKTFDLSPSEVLERMTKNVGRYGHYFKNTQSSGTGGQNNPPINIDPKNMTAEQWKEFRKTKGLR